jgi:hypothetical protein
MNPQNKWLKWTGIVLNILIAGLMIMAASGKVVPSPSPQVVEMLGKHGLAGQIQLIGTGELASAVLLLLPWTAPLGTLLTTGFWGGAICLHMSHGEAYTFQSILLLVTWIGSYLRGSVPLFWFEPLKTATTAK